MKTLNLSRKQYDALVQNHSEYMAKGYQAMTRKWSLSGVQVRGTKEQVAEIAAKL